MNKNFIIENDILVKYDGPGGDVVIPDGVAETRYDAFMGCTGLTSVKIPGSVTKIGNAAFEDCTGRPASPSMKVSRTSAWRRSAAAGTWPA